MKLMYYAIHSKKQAKLAGEVEWQTLSGEIVIATSVEKTPGCPHALFDDKVNLGPVVKFVRRLSYGNILLPTRYPTS